MGQQLRKGYIDATKRRELVLPLPKFFDEVDSIDEAQWFHSGEGRPSVAQAARLEALVAKFGRQEPLTPSEQEEVHEFYRDYRTLHLAERGLLPVADADGAEQDLSSTEVIAWITIRQWAKGTDPNPSLLQRMAGTFVEIGVDYFASMPGALHRESAWGKALGGFLAAMDEVDFAEGRLADLPERLLVAGLETVAAQPELLTGDAKAQMLLQVTTQALSADVVARLAQMEAGDVPAQMRVKDWAELTFRSVLASAGGLVVAQPERYLGVSGEGRGALVTNVGTAVLGLVLDEPDQRLDHVFSRQGLEQVIKAALVTVGEHPEILVDTDNEGLRALLSETATQLAAFDTVLHPDIFPEMLRLVLEKTSQNLELLWPDLKRHPETNLAVTVARATLAALSQPIPGVRWTLRLTKQDLVQVTGTVIDELVANPQWLLDKVGTEQEDLEVVLRAVLKVLSQRGDERISPETAVRVIEEVARAVVLRQEFITRLPEAQEALVVSILDTLLSGLFNKRLDPRASWQLVRAQAIEGLTQVSLRLLSRTRLTPEILAPLKAVIKEQTKALAEGELFTLHAFEERLTLALELKPIERNPS